MKNKPQTYSHIQSTIIPLYSQFSLALSAHLASTKFFSSGLALFELTVDILQHTVFIIFYCKTSVYLLIWTYCILPAFNQTPFPLWLLCLSHSGKAVKDDATKADGEVKKATTEANDVTTEVKTVPNEAPQANGNESKA